MSESKKILVVEDDESHLLLMEIFLERKSKTLTYHIDVTFATSMASACEALNKERFDLISIDGQFIGGTGIELLEKLKGLHYEGFVVFYSANDKMLSFASQTTISSHPVYAYSKNKTDSEDWVERIYYLLSK